MDDANTNGGSKDARKGDNRYWWWICEYNAYLLIGFTDITEATRQPLIELLTYAIRTEQEKQATT